VRKSLQNGQKTTLRRDLHYHVNILFV